MPLLWSADIFFKITLFPKILYTIRASNVLIQIRTDAPSVLICVQPVCKGYMQTTNYCLRELGRVNGSMLIFSQGWPSSLDEPVRWSRLVIVFAARIHESGQKTRVQLQIQKTNITELILSVVVRTRDKCCCWTGQTSTAIFVFFSGIDRLCQTST